MIETAAKILKVLNSNAEPRQISLAFCFSMIAGLTPLFSMHNVIVLLLVLVLNINLSTFILGLAFCSGIAYLLDPLFNIIGLNILTAHPLEGLWTAMYNITFFRLARFNNSIVMGSLAFSLIVFVPVYVLANFLIVKYREKVLHWVRKSHIMEVIKGSKFYSAYKTVSGWKDMS